MFWIDEMVVQTIIYQTFFTISSNDDMIWTMGKSQPYWGSTNPYVIKQKHGFYDYLWFRPPIAAIAPNSWPLPIPGGPRVLVGWAKEKEAIAVDVHKLILKFSDLRMAYLDHPRPSD